METLNLTGLRSGETVAFSNDKDFRDYIIPKIQGILDSQFSNNPAKRKIKIYPDRINFACPFCGDSGHDSKKKRGNIITRGKFSNIYKCHNCGISMGVTKFFDKFSDSSLSIAAIDYVNNNTNKFSYERNIVETSSLLYDIDAIDELCPTRDELKKRFNLEEVSAVDKNYGKTYLYNRCQFDSRRFLYSRENNKLYVLNLTPYGKVFSYQVRNLDKYINPNEQRYKSYNLSNVRKYVMGIDDDAALEYDTLSMLFNALNIDYEKPILITEGPMDSFLLPNCIAMCGGTKRVPLDFDLYFMFDYDEAGRGFTIDALKRGDYVFLWEKFAQDIGLPKRKKWDWNDVIIYSRQNGVKLPNLKEYFTNDKMDMLLI